MQNYDEALGDYTHELLIEIAHLKDEIKSLRDHLSDSYRQIAILQDQLRHYYL
jgi:hypothetical protein